MPFMTDCLPRGSGAAQANYLPTASAFGVMFARMEIGMKIKRARETAGLSQRDLASAIGVSNGAVGQWESHAKKPGRESLGKISRALGITTDSLLSSDASVVYQMLITDALEVRAVLAFRRLSRRQKDNLLELLSVAGDVAAEMEPKREPLHT